MWADNSVSAPYGGLYGDYGLRIASGNSSHIALLPAGNVGIGTSTPVAKLDVNGSANISGSLTLDDNTNTGRINGRNGLTLYSTTSGAGILAQFAQAAGNVTPNYVRFLNINPTFSPQITVDGGDTNISLEVFGKGSGNVYFSNTSGNVGIAKTSANARLDVNGNVIITGSLTVTAPITASALVVTNLNVTTVSSSVVYSSGSNTFGNTQGNKHQFTGSVEITASLTVNSAGGTNAISSTSGTGYSFLANTTTGILYGGTVSSGTDRYFLNFSGNVNSFVVYENSNTPYINSYAGMVLRANQTGGSGGNISLVGGTTYISANLGIGTNSVSNTMLHVVGDWVSGHSTAKIQPLTGTTAGLGLYDSSGNRKGILYRETGYLALETSTAEPLYFNTNGSTKMVVLSGGNVGIGSTAPINKLEVRTTDGYTGLSIYNNKGSGAGTASLQFGLNDGAFVTSDAARIEARVVVNPNMALDFKTYHSSLQTDMTIYNGNVGIGTSSPAATLDIGKNTTTPALKIGNSSYLTSYNSVWGLQTGAQSIMIFGNNGQNEIRAGNTVVGGYLDFYTNNTADYTAASNGNFAMRLAASGNVGIGTNSPNSRLDVSGNTTISGSLNVTGSIAVTGSVNITGSLGINGIIGFGSKPYTVTTSYTTGLTINLSAHTGIFIRVTLHGDLSGNSAIAYMGEFFVQNGDNSYAENGYYNKRS